MAVTNTVRKNIYTLNNSTTVFSYTFDITTTDGSDIHLYLYNSDTAVTTEITSGFTVDTGTKAITYANAANYGNTYKLTISRETTLTQGLDIKNQGSFFAEDVMAALDKHTYADQEMSETLDRCVKLPESSTEDPDTYLSTVQTAKNTAVAAAATATQKAEEAATSEGNVSTMESNVTSMQSDVTAKSENVDTKAADVDTKAADVDTKAASVDTKYTDIVNIQTDITEKQVDVTAKDENVTTNTALSLGYKNTCENLQQFFNIPTQIYPGTILEWAGSSLPYGYLWCDGSAVSRTTYSELFAQIGTTYGSGDGSTTFNLPNLKDKFVLGAGDTYSIGSTGGEITHKLTESELPKITPSGSVSSVPSHTHKFPYSKNDSAYYHGIGTLVGNLGGNGQTLDYEWETESAGGTSLTFTGTQFGDNGEHNNMPPYIVLKHIIKYTVVGKSNADSLYRQNSTNYSVGDVLIGAENLPKSLELVVTTAGKSSVTEPTTWGNAGDTQTDGTVEFTIRYREGAYTGIEKNQTLGTLTGNTTINCVDGSVVNATVGADLAFTLNAQASSLTVRTLTLILMGAGSHVVTWPSNVKWPWGLAPTFSTGTDIVTFMTTDNGTTWYGSLNGVSYA